MTKHSRKAQTPINHGAASDSAATEIVPNVYLGPVSAASSDSFLRSARITHILSIGSTPAGAPRADITYMRLPLKDSPTASLGGTVDAASAWLDQVLQKNKSEGGSSYTSRQPDPTLLFKEERPKVVVLVHCSAAVSRSPSVLAGYLMKSRNMSLFDALGLLVRARPSVSPNPGFVGQLRSLEEALFGRVTFELDELPRTKADREALFALDAGDVGKG